MHILARHGKSTYSVPLTRIPVMFSIFIANNCMQKEEGKRGGGCVKRRYPPDIYMEMGIQLENQYQHRTIVAAVRASN